MFTALSLKRGGEVAHGRGRAGHDHDELELVHVLVGHEAQ